MQKSLIEFINHNKEKIFLLTLYFSVLIGFIYGENSTGGAVFDYLNQKKISQDLSDNFFKTFLNYDSYTTRHSPILIIILSFFENIKVEDSIIRLIHLHFNLLLTFIFYLCLVKKFQTTDKKILFLIVGLIFLSSTYRSLSIWPDSRVIGLTFFCSSIMFYLFLFFCFSVNEYG